MKNFLKMVFFLKLFVINKIINLLWNSHFQGQLNYVRVISADIF